LDSPGFSSRLLDLPSVRRGLVAALLLVFAAQSILAMRLLSATSDETTHLPSGYTYLETGGLRLNPQHPPLVKLLAALPLLILKPRLDLDDRAFKSEPPDEWAFGYRFLYSNDADAILFWGRLPIVLLSMLCGLYVYFWARDLFGVPSGLLALFLFAFCPNILAHSHLVTMDMPLASFGVASLYHAWRFTRSGKRAHLVGASGGLGLALASKFSAVVFLPVLVILLAAAAWRSERPAMPFAGRAESTGGRLARTVVTLAVLLGGALLVTWAIYFFPGDPLFYWKGMTSVNRDHDPAYRYFLMGQFREGGFPSYFFWTFLFKTPLPNLLLGIASSVLYARGVRAKPLDEAFVAVPAVVFFALTAAKADDMGIRYLLPVYPFLFVFASRVARWRPSWNSARLAIALPCLWLLGSAIFIYPDHIAYFNELVGGPARGHLVLDDSNIDWGQDLKRLKAYVDENKIEKLRLLYAWNASPDYYGIPYEAVTKRDWEVEPRPGTYAISTMWIIHGVDTAKRTGVKTDWLGRYRLVGRVGYSFFLFRID
jgi:hypothetical protein